MEHGVFVTAVNCMDGRVQEPVTQWLKQRYSADYVDVITEPAPEFYLAEGNDVQIESIRKRILISKEKHGSTQIALAAHFDCAGNPVPKEEHILQLHFGRKLIKSWFPQMKVLTLWVDENWKVQVV